LIIEKDNKFQVFQDLYNLLEKYPNEKIILTGADDKETKKFGLNGVSYKVFTLKHNPEKTDPEYYKIMLKELYLQKENVVYFEHSEKAVKSAQSVGINTYYYNDKVKNLEKLKKFLDDSLK
jgi:HAD superfamily hydrolase (TIGR01509 family)